MKKHVIFKGKGNECCYASSDTSALVINEVYTVDKVKLRGLSEFYAFKEVDGWFDASWFELAPRTYIALGDSVPEVGKRYTCTRIIKGEDALYMEECTISTVQSVKCVGSGGYVVTTRNSVYLVTLQ